MPIEIIWDFLLVKEVKPKEETESGIIISDSTKPRQNIYEVVQTKNADFMIWDHLVITHYAWDEVEYEWQKYRMIRSDHALAKVTYI
jgi:co-chaperonin GroES (HSP10)